MAAIVLIEAISIPDHNATKPLSQNCAQSILEATLMSSHISKKACSLPQRC